jgi:hypothetical protein
MGIGQNQKYQWFAGSQQVVFAHMLQAITPYS